MKETEHAGFSEYNNKVDSASCDVENTSFIKSGRNQLEKSQAVDKGDEDTDKTEECSCASCHGNAPKQYCSCCPQHAGENLDDGQDVSLEDRAIEESHSSAVEQAVHRRDRKLVEKQKSSVEDLDSSDEDIGMCFNDVFLLKTANAEIYRV